MMNATHTQSSLSSPLPCSVEEDSQSFCHQPKGKKSKKGKQTLADKSKVRKSSGRTVSSTKAKSKIPRPMNCFMIFRKQFSAEKLALNPENRSSIGISMAAGTAWRSLPEAEKRFYRDKAEVERKKHRLKYPNYKYARKKCCRPTEGISQRPWPVDKHPCEEIAKQCSVEKDTHRKGSPSEAFTISEKPNVSGKEKSSSDPLSGSYQPDNGSVCQDEYNIQNQAVLESLVYKTFFCLYPEAGDKLAGFIDVLCREESE